MKFHFIYVLIILLRYKQDWFKKLDAQNEHSTYKQKQSRCALRLKFNEAETLEIRFQFGLPQSLWFYVKIPEKAWEVKRYRPARSESYSFLFLVHS